MRYVSSNRKTNVQIQDGLTTGKSGHKFSMPNFAEEAEMLEWAGISFGEEFTYKLGKSIKVSETLENNHVQRLAIMSGA